MAIDIDHVEHYPCSLDRLYGALTAPAYWHDRVETMAGGGGEVLHCRAAGLDTDDHPAFIAVVRQPVPTTSIPAALRRFAPGAVTVECTESWAVSGDVEAAGTFDSTVQSMPASISARVVLRSVSSEACDMHFRGTVTATMPVVGPMIEKMMVAETAAGFTIEREFTLDWLSRQS